LVYGQYRLAAVWALTRRVSPSTRPRREIYGAHPIPVELLLERVTYIYVSVTTAILLGALGYLLGRQADRLEALSETDALTGLANRRAFRRRLADDLRRARRYGSPVSLLLVDVASISRAHLIRALRWADYGVIAAREYPMERPWTSGSRSCNRAWPRANYRQIPRKPLPDAHRVPL